MSANQYYQNGGNAGYQGSGDRGYGGYGGGQNYAPPSGPPPGQQQYYPPQGQGYPQHQQPVYVQQAQPQRKGSGGDTCCGICLGCCALFACEELCAAFL